MYERPYLPDSFSSNKGTKFCNSKTVALSNTVYSYDSLVLEYLATPTFWHLDWTTKMGLPPWIDSNTTYNIVDRT